MTIRQASAALVAFFFFIALLGLGPVFPTSAEEGGGLRGEYFDTPNLQRLKLTRVDPEINFAWGEGSPDSAIRPETFSVRWSGWVVPRTSGMHRFIVQGDDGVRVWINRQLVMDSWDGSAGKTLRAKLLLKANRKYRIKIEYYENRGDASISLAWKSKQHAREIIPVEQLIPARLRVKTPTRVRTDTPTATFTATRRPTRTKTPSPAKTETPTRRPTRTKTPSPTKTETPTRRPTRTRTPLPTDTETPTRKATRTRTFTPIPTQTFTPSLTRTPTFTRTSTPTRTPTFTRTSTPTRTNTSTATPTRTRTATPTQTFTPTMTPTATPFIFYGVDEGGRVLSREGALGIASNIGVNTLRMGISWEWIEPIQGEYHFERIDPYMERALGAGFAPIVFVSVNPDWAANTFCGPIDTTDPAKLAAFSNLLFELAKRYPRVELWALSNEPDRIAPPDNPDYTGCFGDYVTGDLNANGLNDRADYARMLAAAWRAIHTANPHARLLTGAVAYDSFDSATAPDWYLPSSGVFNYHFLPELFAYMQAHPLPSGEKYFDLLTFNYYDGYARKWEKVSSRVGIQAKADVLDTLMAAYGLNFPMYVGETGADTRFVSEQVQANCLYMTLVRARAYGLSGVVWWTFQDDKHGYGLVSETLAPKKSYTAYQALIRELDGYTYNRVRNGSAFAAVEAYEFKNGAKTKTVIWSSDIKTQPPIVPCAMIRRNRTVTFGGNIVKVRITDVVGTVTRITDNGTGDLDTRVGYIAFRVGNDPLIVQSNP